MNRPQAHWNQVIRADWDAALAPVGASYQQDWAYGAALEKASPGVSVLRATITGADGRLIGLAQVAVRLVGLLARFALCTHGPVWLVPLSAEEKALAYAALKKSLSVRWPRLLVFTPDEPLGAAAGLRGMKRVMTGDATVIIDLRQEEDVLRAAMEQNWRNKLAKAEKSGLVVQRSGTKPSQYRWLLEAETRQRQARGYRAMPLEMTERWQEAKLANQRGPGLAVFRANLGREPVAGMLFLVHGARATYHVGWTSDAGRANAAHNLLLWSAVRELKALGLLQLDLGGVNTQSGAGIARFKLGTGGSVLQRAGAYV